jgi:predicted nucleic acid-binding protein
MSSQFVVDSSVVLSWLFEDESSESSQSILEKIIYKGDTCIAPYLIRFEVPNAILMAVKRKRISEEIAKKTLIFYDILPIEIDIGSQLLTTKSIYSLGQKHGLTIYDASYLELAMRLSLSLATYDSQLIKAAKIEKVVLF